MRRAPCGFLSGGADAAGTVLIVVMWVVLVLAGLVLVFARSMRVEAAASANRLAVARADAAALAALQVVLSQLDGTDGTYRSSDAAISFEAVRVGEGYFWILDTAPGDDRALSFGIRDEASRLNLNRATAGMLLKLPRMTAELAASLIDWRDGDGDVSPGGAESEYYLLLDEPYYCKNAPFECVDEVLLVKGASTEFLHGEDTNRNGRLDENENDGSDREPPDDRDGRLDAGALEFLTVYTVEPNATASGDDRVNVNDVRSQARLSELLREVVEGDRFFQVMDRARDGRPFRNVFDFYARTGLTAQEFARLADLITTTPARELVGLVNVNTAPREVLMCLPGLEESDVDALLARRQTAGTDLSNVGWVAEVLSPEKAVAAGDFITVRSFQFSADIVAVSADGRAFRRYRAVVDARTSPPRVLLWKDLAHLGWPLDREILRSLRRGEGPAPAAGKGGA